jgi:hypothetical protein
VTALHDVIVIESFKGTVDARTVMKQEGAGVCVDDGRRVQGNEPIHRVGDEYIVFLRNGPTAFGRVAGPSLAFAVVEGRVTTHSFAGLPQDVPVAVFRAALAKMKRP